MSKCGECANFLAGGDWDLCCKEKHEGYPAGFLCYETTDACEKFVPIECAICDELGSVVLVKYPCQMTYQGKNITFERWSYHCNKCGRKFEPAWMFDRNLLNIRWNVGKPVKTGYCPLCDKHFEVRSNESHGHCPDCGHHVVLHDEEVADGK